MIASHASLVGAVGDSNLDRSQSSRRHEGTPTVSCRWIINILGFRPQLNWRLACLCIAQCPTVFHGDLWPGLMWGFQWRESSAGKGDKVSAVSSRLLSNLEPLCTEPGQGGPKRNQLSSEECGGNSGGSLGETISSQVLQTDLGTKDSEEVVLTHL